MAFPVPESKNWVNLSGHFRQFIALYNSSRLPKQTIPPSKLRVDIGGLFPCRCPQHQDDNDARKSINSTGMNSASEYDYEGSNDHTKGDESLQLNHIQSRGHISMSISDMKFSMFDQPDPSQHSYNTACIAGELGPYNQPNSVNCNQTMANSEQLVPYNQLNSVNCNQAMANAGQLVLYNQPYEVNCNQSTLKNVGQLGPYNQPNSVNCNQTMRNAGQLVLYNQPNSVNCNQTMANVGQLSPYNQPNSVNCNQTMTNVGQLPCIRCQQNFEPSFPNQTTSSNFWEDDFNTRNFMDFNLNEQGLMNYPIGNENWESQQCQRDNNIIGQINGNFSQSNPILVQSNNSFPNNINNNFDQGKSNFSQNNNNFVQRNKTKYFSQNNNVIDSEKENPSTLQEPSENETYYQYDSRPAMKRNYKTAFGADSGTRKKRPLLPNPNLTSRMEGNRFGSANQQNRRVLLPTPPSHSISLQ